MPRALVSPTRASRLMLRRFEAPSHSATHVKRVQEQEEVREIDLAAGVHIGAGLRQVEAVQEVEEVKGTQDLLLSFTNINTYYKNNDTVIRREVIKASQKLQIKNSSEPKEVLATVETNQEPIVFTDRKWDSVDINVVTTK